MDAVTGDTKKLVREIGVQYDQDCCKTTQTNEPEEVTSNLTDLKLLVSDLLQQQLSEGIERCKQELHSEIVVNLRQDAVNVSAQINNQKETVDDIKTSMPKELASNQSMIPIALPRKTLVRSTGFLSVTEETESSSSVQLSADEAVSIECSGK